jgi:hypothetical protein
MYVWSNSTSKNNGKVFRTLDGLDESFYTLSIKEINVTYKRNKFLLDIQQKALDEKIVRL